MPTYHYRCSGCDQHIEVVQSMTDDPLTECAACSGEMYKVLRPVGIVLKGSGFYRTDNRSKAGKGESKAESKAESKSKSKTDTKTDTKSASSSGSSDSSTSSSSTSTKSAEAKSA